MGLSNIPSFTHIFSPQFWVSKQEATTHFLNTYLNEYSKCKIPELVLQIIFTAAALNLNEQTRGHIFLNAFQKRIFMQNPQKDIFKNMIMVAGLNLSEQTRELPHIFLTPPKKKNIHAKSPKNIFEI